MKTESPFITAVAWLAGFLFSFIGFINIFWGNDPEFGVFIVLLSLLFFPPLSRLLKKLTNFTLPIWLKIVVGVFILWASLGVGELFEKLGMMLEWIKNK